MLKNIQWLGTSTKAKKNMEPAKFFFVDPDTGEGSEMFDTQESASQAAKSLLAKRDETGAQIFISQIVETVASERSFKSSFFGAKR